MHSTEKIQKQQLFSAKLRAGILFLEVRTKEQFNIYYKSVILKPNSFKPSAIYKARAKIQKPLLLVFNALSREILFLYIQSVACTRDTMLFFIEFSHRKIAR